MTAIRREILVVAFILGLAAAIRVPTLNQPLHEEHGFRQTQTAYTAAEFREHGIDLMHSTMPVLGAPFEVPFEFPLYQAVAQLPMAMGLTPVEALRGTNLAFFLLTGALLWLVIREIASPLAGVLALAVFVAAPFGILWGRTALMEYFATAGSLAFVFSVMRWRESRRWPWVVVAIVAGSVAMLVKLTTGVLWLLPALAYTASRDGGGPVAWVRARVTPVMLASFAVPAAVALAWTRHADAIKGAHPATAWLTSAALQQWNFGTLAQRLVPANWGVIAGRMHHYLLGIPTWQFPALMLPALRLRQRNIWLAIGLVVLLGPAVFFNLYVVHVYYLAAISPAVAAVMGLGAAALLTSQYRVIVGLGLVVLAIAWIVTQRPYWSTAYKSIDVATTFPAVRELTDHTTRADLIVVEGYDWSPELLFEARREGQMLHPRFATRAFVTALAHNGYRFLVSPSLSGDTVALLRERVWDGAWTGQLRVMAEDLRGLGGAPVAATDDVTAAPQDTTGVHAPVTINCDAPPTLLGASTQTKTTWIRFSEAPADATITVDGYASLPARRVLRVASGDHAGPASLAISCHGASALSASLSTNGG